MQMLWRLTALAVTLAICAGAACVPEALAVTIELKDVAHDRIERQRAYTANPRPLPGTPDTNRLTERLGAKGLKAGDPLLIRIFKSESQLELWMKKDGAFVHFATYPICNWSGTLGPKLKEGDKQTPEGFYTITRRQLHRLGRWRHALNLGFPNAFDQAHDRDGSYILVHGGCSSAGCFAMTDDVILEIFKLTSAALRGGQYHVPVHVFPFRMTDANIASHTGSEWSSFWSDLKAGYDSFERTHRTPRISVCNGRYHVQDSSPVEEAGSERPLAVCGATAAAILASNAFAWVVPIPSHLPETTVAPVPIAPTAGRETPPADANRPPLQAAQPPRRESPQTGHWPRQAPAEMASPRPLPASPGRLPSESGARKLKAQDVDPDHEYEFVAQLTPTRPGPSAVTCNLARASVPVPTFAFRCGTSQSKCWNHEEH